MALSIAGFILRLTKHVCTISYGLIRHKVHATYHGWTYQVGESPKNVVIVGGSFAGIQAAKFLTETLPSGWRVVLIEKNSHFNFLFAFPRFSVVPGYEKKAFIPYGDITRGAPIGSFQYIQDFVTKIDSGAVWLKSGEKIDFSYLVLATGSTQQLPAKAASTDREGACEELRSVQHQIQDAQRIAIIGAGAVGVEVATDIKSFHSAKDVTIFSSRDKLLPSFGSELHDCASKIMGEMGVVMRYNERATVLPDAKSLQLSNGDVEKFDLIVSDFLVHACFAIPSALHQD
jgi:NADH dehydrogenase FAD-containing subunit